MKILVIDDCFVNVARELDGEGRIPNNSEDVHVEGTPLQSSAEASEFADALIKSMAEDRTAQDNWDPRARGRKRDRVLAARDGGAPERDLWALIMSDENYFGRYGWVSFQC